MLMMVTGFFERWYMHLDGVQVVALVIIALCLLHIPFLVLRDFGPGDHDDESLS